MSALPEGAAFDEDGVWTQILALPEESGAAALFLDRDGVLVEEVNYLSRPSDVRLIPGAAEAVSRANNLGIPVIIVTNQAGIAYGYYGWDEFMTVQARILGDLSKNGAFVNGVFACPFHAKGKPPYAHPNHPARKPNPGMILSAGKLFGLNLSTSWMVGDRAQDLEAGARAGLAGGVHVLTGHGSEPGERDKALALAQPAFQALAADSISNAASLVPLLGRG